MAKNLNLLEIFSYKIDKHFSHKSNLAKIRMK